MRLAGVTPVLLVTLALLNACAGPQYDDQADKLITQLQTDFTTEITTLITLDEKIEDLKGTKDPAGKAELVKAQTAAGYYANVDAYAKIGIDLILLKARIARSPNWGATKVGDAIDLLTQQLVGKLGAATPEAKCGGPNPNSSMRSTHKACGILSISYLTNTYDIVSNEIDLLSFYSMQIKNGQTPGGAASSSAKQ